MSAGLVVDGIVRPARRPHGWHPPGPKPPASFDPRLGPRAGEDLCYLAGDFRILQRVGGHRWSLDDLVTADFAASSCRVEAPSGFADLGCGIGSVLMMLAWRFPGATGMGLEAQRESVDLAVRSLSLNGLAERCSVHRADLRSGVAPGPFDLVTGTPPYLPPDAASGSSDPQRRACRLETRGGIEDYCRAAARRLAPGARFVCCMPGPPDGRVGGAAREAGLEIERHRDVVPRAGKRPLFGLWSLTREPTPSGPVQMPDLVVRDEKGCWTPEMRRIRRDMGMPIGRVATSD